jgi:hypothetical protein
MSEMVTVHIVCRARVEFDQTIRMTREKYEGYKEQIDADDDVDLFNVVNYHDPLEEEVTRVETFELVADE